MNIFRNIIAVVVGYAVFVISALLLFKLSGVDPHADPSWTLMLSTVIYGILFSFISGILTQVISKSGRLTVNYVLSAIIAGFAAFSLFKTSGNHYSQLAAIFLFAPAALLGGVSYLRKRK